MAEQNPDANIAPNIDAELDDALSKSFAGAGNAPEHVPVVEKNKAPDEAGKVAVKTEEPKVELKPELEIKNEKPKEVPVEDKNLPDPDQISDQAAGKSNTSKEGWAALKNNYKKAHRLISEKDTEIAKLKSTIADSSAASKKELEAIRAEKAELEKYRAMIDIQADPEFISKYDKPVEDAITGIKSMIKGMQVSQETVDAIDFKDPARLQQIVDIIAQNKDRFTAAKLERKISDYLQLADKRNETLESEKNNYKETLEKRKQEAFAKGAEGEGRMMKHVQLKSGEKNDDGKPLIPFLNKIQPSENATQADIDQINNHNGMVDAMNKKLEEVLKMREPEQQAEVAIAAVASHWLMGRLKAVEAELKKEREEKQKIAAVQSEAPARRANNPTGKNGRSDEIMDTDQALASFGFRGR